MIYIYIAITLCCDTCSNGNLIKLILYIFIFLLEGSSGSILRRSGARPFSLSSSSSHARLTRSLSTTSCSTTDTNDTVVMTHNDPLLSDQELLGLEDLCHLGEFNILI